MVLTIFVIWLVLAALAAFFMYCCSRVSEGRRRENSHDQPAEPAPTRATTAARTRPV